MTQKAAIYSVSQNSSSNVILLAQNKDFISEYKVSKMYMVQIPVLVLFVQTVY